VEEWLTPTTAQTGRRVPVFRATDYISGADSESTNLDAALVIPYRPTIAHGEDTSTLKDRGRHTRHGRPDDRYRDSCSTLL
jgi:hypothetical protein